VSINDRLKRLESELPERCDNCRTWGNRLLVIDDHSDGTDSEPTGPPERCGECGYEPPTIIIEHTHEAARM
jgi:hypothetical protein